MTSPGLSSTKSTITRVLAVDLDELTLGKVESALRGTELTMAVTSQRDAVERVRVMGDPVIVLLDWSEEQQHERVQLCSALRAVTRPDACYIVALGGPSDQSALSDAMGGAANDVLTRPFGNGMLLGRLRKGLRAMMGAPAPAPARAALEEALRDHRTGEVVIRAGEKVAFIHLQEGQIVWVHVSFLPTTMEDVARQAGAALDPHLVTDVKEECRLTGANFLDVLVRWGVLAEHSAKQALREMVGERVKIALELPDAVALFIPRNRAQSGAFRIRTSEIPSLQTPIVAPIGASAGALALPAPPAAREAASTSQVVTPPEAGWFVHEAMKTEGAMCAALLDRRSGACLFHVGAQMNAAIAWSLVSALAALGPGADEVLAVVGEKCFVTRPLRHASSCALFVALSSSSTTLGFARIAIARVSATRVSTMSSSPRSVRLVDETAPPVSVRAPDTARSPGSVRR